MSGVGSPLDVQSQRFSSERETLLKEMRVLQGQVEALKTEKQLKIEEKNQVDVRVCA
jgi:hypothetical protein